MMALLRDRRSWARLFLLAAIATAALIFWFSAQQAEDSQALSDGVTVQVARVVRRDYDAMPAESQLSLLSTLSHVVRKCAHFLEYTLLGFNLMGWLGLRTEAPRPPREQIIAWIIATLYAGTDELHQMFVSGRGPGLLDVGIDSGGALTGALLMTLLLALVGWWTRRHASSSQR